MLILAKALVTSSWACLGSQSPGFDDVMMDNVPGDQGDQ